MSLRRQLPVRSPLSMGALAAGVGGWLDPDAGYREKLTAVLESRLGFRDIVLTDSGTSALSLAMRAALAERPGPVALPAWGCPDLATAALGAGASVALYDLDPATLSPDPASLRAAFGLGARVVVVAHFFGVAVDMAALARDADAAGALIIEDAAQAFGATLGGRPLGGFGPLSVLSFGRGKGWTGGGGGALLGAPGVASMIGGARAALSAPDRGTRELVGTAAQWLLARPSLYALPASLPFLKLGETVFHPPHAPRVMATAAAAATLASAPLADAEVASRRGNAEWLLARVTPAFTPIRAPLGAAPGWLRLPLVAGATAAVAARQERARELGIMMGYPQPLGALPGFAVHCRNADVAAPGAVLLAERLVTLPTHSALADGDRERLARWMETP